MTPLTHSFAPVLPSIRAHDPNHDALRLIGQDGIPSRVLTYGELCARIDDRAALIAGSGGNVVMLAEPHIDEFIAWFFGALAAGRWVLPVPTDAPPREVARLALEAGAATVVGSAAEPIAGGAVLALTDGARATPAPGQAGGIILRTSGTTGIPKLVRRTHASLDAVASNVRDAAALTPEDTVLAAIPAWHSYGVENVMLGPLVAGCTIACCERFDAGVCERLLRTGATAFPGVPMMFEALSRGGPIDDASLRLAYSAGSSLAAEIDAAFAARWGRPVGQLYGATDVGSVTFNDPGSSQYSPGSVGVAMNGVSIRILDEDDHDVPVGAEGQVAVSAPSMLAGYLGDQPLDLVDGHLRMGDLGFLDAHGRLTITGMLKFLIDVGGMKVNPLEVEGVLREHPHIGDCAVVAMQVSSAVSRVRAIVTPGDGEPPQPDAIRRWMKDRLAPHKVPRVVEVVPVLPRTPTGKLQRRALEEA